MTNAAASTLTLAAAKSRLGHATFLCESANKTVGQRKRWLSDEKNPSYYAFAVRSANAAAEAEDAALRWVAAAQLERDTAPTQMNAAALGTATSQAAVAALTAAEAAARSRVDYLLSRIACRTPDLRNSKSELYTAEYRLILADLSAAAAVSRLSDARASRISAISSIKSIKEEEGTAARTLLSAWLKATEAAVDAAEKWVTAAGTTG